MIFGHPWHGRWTEAGIELPNGTVMPMEASPQGADAFEDFPVDVTQPSHGDVLAVAIPGVAPVATPPAQASLGMTWLPYALISGVSHVFYGRRLGLGSWVYVDPDGGAWIGSIAPLVVAQSPFSVTFTKITFSGPAESHTVVFDAGAYTSFAGPAVIMDADLLGQRVAIGYRTASHHPVSVFHWLRFDGHPSDLSITTVTPATPGFSTIDWPIGQYGFDKTYVRPGNKSVRQVVAIMFGDDPVDVFIEEDVSVTARMDRYGPVTTTGVISFGCGSVRYDWPVSVTTTWYSILGVWRRVSEVTVNGQSYSLDRRESEISFGGDYPSFGIRRRAAKVYEVLFSQASGTRSVGFLTPDRFIAHDGPDDLSLCVAYHPVTREFVVSPTPVSFV